MKEPAGRHDWTGGEEDAGTRELVRRYTDASVATEVDGIAALLRHDATWARSKRFDREADEGTVG